MLFLNFIPLFIIIAPAIKPPHKPPDIDNIVCNPAGKYIGVSSVCVDISTIQLLIEPTAIKNNKEPIINAILYDFVNIPIIINTIIKTRITMDTIWGIFRSFLFSEFWGTGTWVVGAWVVGA